MSDLKYPQDWWDSQIEPLRKSIKSKGLIIFWIGFVIVWFVGLLGSVIGTLSLVAGVLTYEWFGTGERLQLRLSGKLLCGRSQRFMAPWHLVGLYTSIVVFAGLSTIGNIVDAVVFSNLLSKYCNSSSRPGTPAAAADRAMCDDRGPDYKFEIARAVIGIFFYGGVGALSWLSLKHYRALRDRLDYADPAATLHSLHIPDHEGCATCCANMCACISGGTGSRPMAANAAAAPPPPPSHYASPPGMEQQQQQQQQQQHMYAPQQQGGAPTYAVYPGNPVGGSGNVMMAAPLPQQQLPPQQGGSSFASFAAPPAGYVPDGAGPKQVPVVVAPQPPGYGGAYGGNA